MKKLIAVIFLVIFLTGCQTGVIVEPDLPETVGEYGGSESVDEAVVDGKTITGNDPVAAEEFENTSNGVLK